MAEKPSAPRLGERLRNAPWWVTALLMGLPPGLAVGTFWGVVHGDALLGLVAGSFWFLLGGPGTYGIERLRRRRARAALGGVPEGQAEVAVRAATTGAVPADPEVREAALRLATHQLVGFTRAAPWFLLGAGAIGVLAVVCGIVVHPVMWLGLLFAVGFAVAYLVQRAGMRRRVALLRGDDRFVQHSAE